MNFCSSDYRPHFSPTQVCCASFSSEIEWDGTDKVEFVFSPEMKALDVEALRQQLDTRFVGVGDRLLYFPVVDSTNTVAMQLAHERPEEGVVVLTDSQTAGKGRQGRQWVDVSGWNVLLSTLLWPLFPPHMLVMVASLAVVNTIAETCRISANIKWPNDVLIGERKVAGILIETSHDSAGHLVAVLGIGVNVNGHMRDLAGEATRWSDAPPGEQPQPKQVPLLATATTLETEYGQMLSRETFIAHLLRYIETDYLALQQEAREVFSTAYRPTSRLIRERWRSQLSTLGRTIEVRQGDALITGIAEDVDDNGELLLRRHSGEQVRITWGDVGYPAS